MAKTIWRWINSKKYFHAYSGLRKSGIPAKDPGMPAYFLRTKRLRYFMTKLAEVGAGTKISYLESETSDASMDATATIWKHLLFNARMKRSRTLHRTVESFLFKIRIKCTFCVIYFWTHFTINNFPSFDTLHKKISEQKIVNFCLLEGWWCMSSRSVSKSRVANKLIDTIWSITRETSISILSH